MPTFLSRRILGLIPTLFAMSPGRFAVTALVGA
jgi:hypothetical protein